MISKKIQQLETRMKNLTIRTNIYTEFKKDNPIGSIINYDNLDYSQFKLMLEGSQITKYHDEILSVSVREVCNRVTTITVAELIKSNPTIDSSNLEWLPRTFYPIDTLLQFSMRPPKRGTRKDDIKWLGNNEGRKSSNGRWKLYHGNYYGGVGYGYEFSSDEELFEYFIPGKF